MTLGNTFPSLLWTPLHSIDLFFPAPLHVFLTPFYFFFFFLFLHLSLHGQRFPSIGMEYEWQVVHFKDKTDGRVESWKKLYGKIPHLYFYFHFKILIHSNFSVSPSFFLSVVSCETLCLLFNSFSWIKPKQYSLKFQGQWRREWLPSQRLSQKGGNMQQDLKGMSELKCLSLSFWNLCALDFQQTLDWALF